MNFAVYMILEILLLINLNYHIFTFENMGVAETLRNPIYDLVHRAPLLTVLELATAPIAPMGATAEPHRRHA